MTNRLLMTTAALAFSAGSAAFAQDATPDTATLTCADFVAMSADDQETAFIGLFAGPQAGAVTEAVDPAVTDDVAPDTAETADAADTTSEADATADTADATEDTPVVQDLIDACTGNDDMLISDALSADM